MRLFASFLTVLLAALRCAAPAGAADARSFGPPGCEFVVAFPEPASVAEPVTADGRAMTAARLTVGSAELAAACTTGYPPEALASLLDEQLLAFADRLIRLVGVVHPQVGLRREPDARVLHIAGALPDGRDARTLQTRIYYGRRSRLIVEAISSESDAESDVRSTFLESVSKRDF